MANTGALSGEVEENSWTAESDLLLNVFFVTASGSIEMDGIKSMSENDELPRL